jgi:hypothetical protein
LISSEAFSDPESAAPQLARFVARTQRSALLFLAAGKMMPGLIEMIAPGEDQDEAQY